MHDHGCMKHVQIRMEDDLHAWLTAYAKADRRSVNQVVIIWLEKIRDEQRAAEREREGRQ
jgi:predicted HicB family RNase H-like nuclease